MQNIFLIGLSGGGKSTVGRALAERLGRSLCDTDALIEEECGASIATIFAERGEAYFRSCESRALARAVQRPGAVVATGGGMVENAAHMRLMRAHGVVIYLSVDAETAVKRVQAQVSEAQERGEGVEIRPLLAGPDAVGTLQRVLERRQEAYEDAHYTCATRDKSVEGVTQELLAMLVASGELGEGAPLVRHIHCGVGYDAVVEWGGLGRLGFYLRALKLPPRLFLITDSNVGKLYASMLVGALSASGFDAEVYTIPAGEVSKSVQQLDALYDWLVEKRAERGEAIVALGGGVVGDLAGFAAATYLRGLPLVQAPVSLLAQVDAAIGGKTGINHAKGKNLIGAFYQPRFVLADPAALLTLPMRERTEGWAEVVKYGIILDTELFVQLESHADILRAFSDPPAALMCQIVARCIDLKAGVVEEDEREQGRRALLNYGHTVAHALEHTLGYGELLHGEAVALGMAAAGEMAVRAGMFSRRALTRQNRLLAALGLPVACALKVDTKRLLESIQLDKKVAGKEVRWIMPRNIGRATVTTMPDELVGSVITDFFPMQRL